MYCLRILNCKYQTISFIFQYIKTITSLKTSKLHPKPHCF